MFGLRWICRSGRWQVARCRRCRSAYKVTYTVPRMSPEGIPLPGDLCLACATAAVDEEWRDSFACLIPDAPLTRYEQVAEGLATLGLRHSSVFRDARVKILDGELHLSAKGPYTGEVEIACVKPDANAVATVSPLPAGVERRGALGRMAAGGAACGVVIALGVAGKMGRLDVLPLALVLGLVGGMIISALFALPALTRSDRNLHVAYLPLMAGEALTLVMLPEQVRRAKDMLARTGLRLDEAQRSDEGSE